MKGFDPECGTGGAQAARLPGTEEPVRRSGAFAAAACALLLACGACGNSAGSRGAGQGSSGSAPPPAGETSGGITRGRVVTEGGRTFEVEVVQDDASRQRGLQRRATVPEGEGMLFLFPSAGQHRFWMYDCRIPLDIIWLDAGARVTHVEERLPPCPSLPCKDYGPTSDSLYVLELGAGVAARSGIRPGQRLEMLFAEPPRPQ